MSADICFVIPVRHQDNMRNPAVQKQYLSETINSIAAQTNTSWKLVVVANENCPLPEMPPQGIVQRVDFPPNSLHERAGLSFEAHMEPFRKDKGRRCMAAQAHFEACRYTMIVDDDDFVHRDLVSFVEKSKDIPGYYFEYGYMWKTGGAMLYPTANFFMKCGTSQIVRSDLFARLAQSYDDPDQYLKEIFGAHIFMKKRLEALGEPLQPLPFPGAIYRTGHVGSHSAEKTQHQFVQSFAGGRFRLSRPDRILRHLARFRPVASQRPVFALP